MMKEVVVAGSLGDVRAQLKEDMGKVSQEEGTTGAKALRLEAPWLFLKKVQASETGWWVRVQMFCLPSNPQPWLPWWFSGKESACQCRRLRFNPWLGKIPWRRKWQLTPVFLPGESHRQKSLMGYNSCGSKELDTTHQVNNHHNSP